MSEPNFGFMQQAFFVDDLPHRKSKTPLKLFGSTSRSHAARVAHERRKAVRASKGLQLKTCDSKDGTILCNAKLADVPTYEHRGKAMAALRRHMARGQGITDAMLLTVCFLALLERRYDELEAHNTHKQILGTLVSARGGLDAISPYIKSVLMQYEFPWAMETGSSVLPRTQRRQPLYPPSYSTRTLLQRIHNLPEGFAVLALQGQLSTHLLSILQRFAHFESGELQHDSNNSQTGYVFDDFWDAFPPLSFQDAEEPSLDNLLFLCLLVYAGVRYSAIPQVNNIAVCMRASLKAKLLECHQFREPAVEQCLCWIWTVAVSSWRQTDGTLDKPGVELLVRQRRRFFYLGSEEEHEMVLRKFFWCIGCWRTSRELFEIRI
ncbi:hypothetical protein BJX76DRAFT_233028 [Aspergillus varians]